LFVRTPEFDEALAATDHTMRWRLPAVVMQRFERPWLDGVAETELARSGLDFKQLHGAAARGVGLRQLTFFDDFRLHLIIPQGIEPPTIFYVHAYRKSRRDETSEIERGAAAARRQLERLGWTL
jgi:hypothetical protein